MTPSVHTLRERCGYLKCGEPGTQSEQRQKLLPLAEPSSSSPTVRRPSGFCCSDTATTRYVEAPPSWLRAGSHWLVTSQLQSGPGFLLNDCLSINSDSASRVLSSAHNTLHYAAYI